LRVPQSHLTFLDGPDGGVVEDIPRLLPEFKSLMSEIRPDRVVTTAFEQGHLDHDATNFLVNHTYDGPVFEVPLYHTYLTRFPKMGVFADPCGQELLPLSPAEQALKIRLAKLFPSQTIWRNVVAYSILNRVRLQPMHLRDSERLRLQTHQEFLRPNLPPHLARRVIASDPWRRWERSIRRLEIGPPMRKRIQVI